MDGFWDDRLMIGQWMMIKIHISTDDRTVCI